MPITATRQTFDIVNNDDFKYPCIMAMAASEKYGDLQDFFTEADEIRSIMVSLLGDVSSSSVLEPCAGSGLFLRDLLGSPSLIDAVELHPPYVQSLRASAIKHMRVIEGDFLEIGQPCRELFRKDELLNEYDFVICNPPYGLKLSLEHRRRLKKTFPQFYVRESYGLFLRIGISRLRRGGRFCFIVPDTFLLSNNHRPLRSWLSEQCDISHLLQFDCSRFKTVNFGYGNLCILAGERKGRSEPQSMLWLDAVGRNEPLSTLLQEAQSSARNYVSQTQLGRTAKMGWAHPSSNISVPAKSHMTSLGNLAECKTGIYTGDNSRFVGHCCEIRGRNAHSITWSDNVRMNVDQNSSLLSGFTEPPFYVPLVRGGHRHPFEKTSYALQWSVDAVKYYKEDKKARFQNSSYYFRSGLAVPMVTSGRISASLMGGSVFDQGVVGVFPFDDRLINYLLIFLNSPQATTAKKKINPSANNSANYLKLLPVPEPDEKILSMADSLMASALKHGWEQTSSARNEFINSLYQSK